MIGFETVRYETIGELRRGIADIAKKTGDVHELNKIATWIIRKRAMWFRSDGLNVVATINGDALLILLGWGDDLKGFKEPMKAVLIDAAKQNGLKKLQVCSPRKGWARVFGIKPSGDLYEENI